ncbi:acetyltransferase (GNAT) family protein [Murinocardiopsis flavida]|uniref:Acetyltransferase (GNAT) family protein n=1 Tax=Murinocardiopsis flavida TaxID=645275 RepID=A0A2P8D8S6_9ACTN|nr:GNAT family N-acetyltransferase [Murinocardiopsis flavida]PSK93625.1 acetyltransferase (GNAT) family protein [Murinocardiopsis flavida]
MKIIDIGPGDDRLGSEVLPVLLELRPHLTETLLHEVYDEGHRQGLRFSAAYTDGACAGVAGWRVMVGTSALRKLYVDDLVTAERGRSAGVGRALLGYLEQRARDLGCHRLDLDSGVQRHDAHRFYFRERMDIAAFHFDKRLG